MTRSWFAHCQYEGKAEFDFGTVHTSRQEGEEAARGALEALLDTVFPIRPAILGIEAGMILVVPE